MSKYDAELRDWRKEYIGDGFRIIGKVYGDIKGRFDDGERIYTSYVTAWIDDIVTTKNSKYKLVGEAREFKTTILWGEAPEKGDRAETYTFASQAELDAFLWGVDVASGWMNHSFEEEGFVVPTRNGPYNTYIEKRERAL